MAVSGIQEHGQDRVRHVQALVDYLMAKFIGK
jgi:hypothetical protein